jgi:flagellar biosynthetic protein FliR
VIEALPALVFHAVLVMARLGAALMLLPGLGEPDVPTTIRLALALVLVAVLLPGLEAGLPGLPTDVPTLLLLVTTEIAIGLWLGFLARLVTLALAQAGQVMAMMIGLASPLQTDPSFGAQGTATARLFGLVGAVLVLSTGLYALPLRALAESYTVLPAGGSLPIGAQAESLAQAVAGSLGLALRLAAPLLLAAILGNFGLGLLARLAPQVQVFSIAAPGQIIAGLLLLALMLAPILAEWLGAAQTGFANLPGLR